MDHRHRQRQSLANAEGKGLRQVIGMFGEPELIDKLVYPPGDPWGGNVKYARMELEILPHRQLRVERKRLRHIADPLAGFDVVGVHGATEQARLARAGG